jgi:hypothetical protein
MPGKGFQKIGELAGSEGRAEGLPATASSGKGDFSSDRFFLFSDYFQSRRILPQSTIAFHKEKHIMGFGNE